MWERECKRAREGAGEWVEWTEKVSGERVCVREREQTQKSRREKLKR
jgi:hypothetical protein